jgi:hypothetical protein
MKDAFMEESFADGRGKTTLNRDRKRPTSAELA